MRVLALAVCLALGWARVTLRHLPDRALSDSNRYFHALASSMACLVPFPGIRIAHPFCEVPDPYIRDCTVVHTLPGRSKALLIDFKIPGCGPVILIPRDCRNDLLSSNGLAYLNAVWHASGVDALALTYGVMPLGDSAGILEYVPGMVDYDTARSQFLFLSRTEFTGRLPSLVRTLVGAKLGAYFLGLGDRHGGNVLLSQDMSEVMNVDLEVIFQSEDVGRLNDIQNQLLEGHPKAHSAYLETLRTATEALVRYKTHYRQYVLSITREELRPLASIVLDRILSPQSIDSMLTDPDLEAPPTHSTPIAV